MISLGCSFYVLMSLLNHSPSRRHITYFCTVDIFKKSCNLSNSSSSIKRSLLFYLLKNHSFCTYSLCSQNVSKMRYFFLHHNFKVWTVSDHPHTPSMKIFRGVCAHAHTHYQDYRWTIQNEDIFIYRRNAFPFVALNSELSKIIFSSKTILWC